MRRIERVATDARRLMVGFLITGAIIYLAFTFG